MPGILIRYTLGRLRRYLAHHRAARLTTLVVFIIVLGFFALEMYIAFRYGFRAIARNEFLEKALLLYVIELFTLASFLLLMASAGMSGLWAFFRSDDDTALMASPRYAWKPWLVFGRVFLLASWPLFLVMLPALVALGKTYQMSIGGALVALGAIFIMAGVAILIAFVAILLIAHVLLIGTRFARRALLSRGRLTMLVLTLYGIFIGMVADRFASINLIRFFQARILEVNTPDLGPVFSLFGGLPSHPAAEILFRAATNDIVNIFAPFGILLGVFAALLCLLFLFSRSFLPVWQALLERPRGGVFARRLLLSGIFAKISGPNVALVAKEAVAFVRNGRGMLWILFILLIWLMQVGAARVLAHHLEDERVAIVGGGALEMVALVTIIYFASIIVLRFVFPSFSSERRTSWIVRCAPIDLFRSYVAKLTFFSILTLFLTFSFASLNLSAVGVVSYGTAALLYLYVAVATCFIVTFGLSLGAIFPSTETDDPELLSTTLPGLGFIGGSLAYGAILAVLFWGTLSFGMPFVIGFLALSLTTATLLVVRSRKSLLRPVE